MSRDLAASILSRAQLLEGRRRSWEHHWQDLLDYVLPAKADVTGTRPPGSKRTEKQFDATATDAAELLAASLMGAVTPASVRWFDLKFEATDATLPASLTAAQVEDRAARRWLEQSAERLFAALRESNFYSEMWQVYLDAVTVGTAAIRIEERAIRGRGFQGLAFRALPIGEYAIDEDPDGMVDTLYRRFRMTARQVVDKWPESVAPEVRRLAAKDPTQQIEILHAVAPRETRLGVESEGDKRAEAKPWSSTYIDVANAIVLEAGGFDRLPYQVYRWSKAAGEVYGRSPAMKVLPDVKTLNALVRLALEGLTLAVYPPWLVPRQGINDRLRLSPGAVNIYDPRIDGEIRALESRSQWAVEVQKEADLRDRIRQGFSVDQLRLKQSPQMTATEVLQRREELNRVIGPQTARLESELLDGLIETAWILMFKAGAFGEPPGSIGQAGRAAISYLGALARAQRLGPVRAVADAFTLLGPIAGFRPDVLDLIDADAIARETFAVLGVPERLLRAPDVVESIRRDRAEQDAATAQLDANLAIADRVAKFQLEPGAA